MIEHLNAHWSIRARLALIGVVFATGALTSTGLLAHSALQRVEHAEAEHEGVRALEQIWRAMQGGDAAGLQEIATQFGVEEEIAELVQAPPGERQHHGVVAIEAIAQRSQLVANPDPIIFEAAQMISGDLPALVDQGDQVHAAMNVADPVTRAALLGDAAQRLSDAWTLSQALLTDVARATPQDTALQQESEALDAAAASLIAALRANAPSSQISADLGAFDAALDRTWRACASALEVKLDEQVAETEREIAIEIGLTLALVVLGGIFAWAISTGLSRRFQALRAAMEAIRAGDQNFVVPYMKDRNETGDIALTLRTLQGLLNAISRSMGVIEFDLDGKIRDANESFLGVVGYRREELIGRHHSLLCAPEFAASSQYRDLWKSLGDGQFVADKIERRAKDGRKLILQGAYNPIFGADGKPAKVVKFVFDLTAQEEMREQAEAERRVRAQEQQVVVEGLAQGLLSLAAGDLTTSIDNTFAADYERLRADFNAACAKLRETLSIIAASGDTLRTGAGEISGAADDLSRRTEQQAASLEETAAALDQITATVRKTAAGARQADASANQAKADAQKSGDVVAKAVAAMSEIERSSTQINQIIGVIDEIAFQTNLLALNAGVEAARAGEAGRGFAVVASEVRALAQRSAEAAKEIKTLISLSADHVGAGVTLVGEAGDALGGIVSRVNEVSSLVAEIAASAQEQASALVQVNTAINQMDQVTQQNAAMVEQSTAASASLDNEAKALMDLIGQFNVGGRPAAQRSTPPRVAAVVRGAQAVGWREF